MQFNSIEIENFGTIGHVMLELQNRGLVLVTGVNKDTPKASSNGAGKSLLLEAFCWCIWGRTVREDKDDDVVNDRVGKNCKVSVIFEENGKRFTVTRYRKHNKSRKPNDLELFLEDTELSGASMKATQLVINGLVGLTFETFCVLMPGAGKNVAQMTDTDIKELLENMLQITALAKARVETKRRLDKLVLEIQKLELKMSALDTQISRDKKRRDDYHTERQVYDTQRQAKIEALGETKAQNIASVVRANTTLEAGEATLREIDRITAKKSQLGNTYGSLKEQLQEIEYKMGRVRTRLNRDISETRGELKVRRAEFDKAMRLGTYCSACSQDISEDHTQLVRSAAEDKVSTLQASIANCDKLCKECDKEEEDARSPILEAVRKLQTELDLHDASIQNLKPVVDAAKTARAQLPGLEKAVEAVEYQIVELGAEKSPYEVWIQELDDQIAIAAADHQDKHEELEQKCELEAMLEFWKKAFSPSGIRSFILDNVTPVLNESVAHYCDLLTDGEMSVNFSTKTQLKNGETRERFSINIKQKHGGKSYKSNSTGEKQRANLVTAFALSDLAELHSNKRIDFRFLDEPFEGIDELGTDAVIALLREQQSRYPTVFVVTHQSHFKEVFPVEISMVKEGGMSHLEG